MILAVDSFDNWTSIDFINLNELLKWNSFLLLERFLEFKFNIMIKIHKGRLTDLQSEDLAGKREKNFWQMTWDLETWDLRGEEDSEENLFGKAQ